VRAPSHPWSRLGALLTITILFLVMSCSGSSSDQGLSCPDGIKLWGVSDLAPRAHASEAFGQAMDHLADDPQQSHLADEAAWQLTELSGGAATWERVEKGQIVAEASFARGTEGWTFSGVNFCGST